MTKIIKKLKLFLDRVVKSLTKFEYYKEIQKAQFSFSLKYLFFLFYLTSVIGSLIFAISVSTWFLPKIPEFVRTFESKATSLYPKDLIVNVKDGIITTNQKEPYYVDTLNQLNLNEGFDHFITIDTTAEPSDIKNHSTVVLVTKDAVTTINDKAYKVYPIDQTANYIIDKNAYTNLIAQISPYLKYLEPLGIILVILSVLLWPFVGAALSLIGQLIYLAIFTGLLFLIIKLLKKNITYKKLYQLSMHGSTLPILLTLVVTTLGFSMPFLLGSAILLIFMILVLNQL